MFTKKITYKFLLFILGKSTQPELKTLAVIQCE